MTNGHKPHDHLIRYSKGQEQNTAFFYDKKSREFRDIEDTTS